MKLMKTFTGREGVTLIELLVVILIIVILAVAMLPVLTPFVTRAKYAADGIPALGNLRTQIQLFYTDKEYLPGLNRAQDGTVLRGTYVPGPPPVMTPALTAILGLYGNSALGENVATPLAVRNGLVGYGQTLDKSGTLYIQRDAAATTASGAKWADIWLALTDNDAKNNHFSTDLDISPSDLLGNSVSPDCIVYACAAGSCKGNTYLYVVGCFGNGDKLKSGTGYAILQVNNPNHTANPSFTATWKRWKPKYRTAECTAEQVNLIMTTIAGINAMLDPAKAENCAYPEELLGDATTPAATFANALTALKTAGWEF